MQVEPFDARAYLLYPFTPWQHARPEKKQTYELVRTFLAQFDDAALLQLALAENDATGPYFIWAGGPPISIYFGNGSISVCPHLGVACTTPDAIKAADHVKQLRAARVQ